MFCENRDVFLARRNFLQLFQWIQNQNQSQCFLIRYPYWISEENFIFQTYVKMYVIATCFARIKMF
jgi:hypothetical protein